MLQAIVIYYIERGLKRMLFAKLKQRFLNSKFLKGKLTYLALAPLVFGLVAQILGIDIAPTEVDSVVTGLSTLLVIFGRARAVHQALQAGYEVGAGL